MEMLNPLTKTEFYTNTNQNPFPKLIVFLQNHGYFQGKQVNHVK